MANDDAAKIKPRRKDDDLEKHLKKIEDQSQSYEN